MFSVMIQLAQGNWGHVNSNRIYFFDCSNFLLLGFSLSSRTPPFISKSSQEIHLFIQSRDIEHILCIRQCTGDAIVRKSRHSCCFLGISNPMGDLNQKSPSESNTSFVKSCEETVECERTMAKGLDWDGAQGRSLRKFLIEMKSEV